MCFTNLNSKAFALSGAVRIPQIVGCGVRSRRRESKMTSKIMRTTFFKAFNLLLVSFGLWASNARACDVFFDFNGVDPQTLMPPPYDQFGKAHWVDNLDGTGYVSITDAGNGQVSVIIFRDCDAGAIIGHFAIDMDLRLGAPSTSNPPADGMSIKYARAEDPIFVLAG